MSNGNGDLGGQTARDMDVPVRKAPRVRMPRVRMKRFGRRGRRRIRG
jgi:hypothetical protein